MLKSILNSEGVQELNKMQQKSINGGVGDQYYCECSGSVGAWYGTYSSQAAADSSLETWCASETGNCWHLEESD
ncbi:hypothetical protein [Pseudotenacibaculum haliotis]|uniref:Natural product n=1 Tax=Pseudotenacibaculum haliotis TaxID=1862138 RepID=A0ABW5LSA6_9FLAO